MKIPQLPSLKRRCLLSLVPLILFVCCGYICWASEFCVAKREHIDVQVKTDTDGHSTTNAPARGDQSTSQWSFAEDSTDAGIMKHKGMYDLCFVSELSPEICCVMNDNAPPFQSTSTHYYSSHQEGKPCRCHEPTESVSKSGVWLSHHKRMVEAANTTKNKNNPLDVVLIGDSLIELWNGTMNLGARKIPAMRQVFDEFFKKAGGGAIEGLALGSSADQISHLLWHLQKGILEPDTLQPKVWLILIGTNDLGFAGCSSQTTFRGIVSLVEHLSSMRPHAMFLVHGLLPRGDPKSSNKMKLGLLWPAIQEINEKLQCFTEKHENYFYVDTGSIFLNQNRTHINPRLMKDGLHPSLAGMKIWGSILVETVQKILQKIL